jgi:hypothetical protein
MRIAMKVLMIKPYSMVALLLMSVASSVAQNRVVNGSFESGADGWVLGSSAAVTTLEKKDGLSSLALSNDGSSTRQNISVDAGTAYHLSVWINAEDFIEGAMVFDTQGKYDDTCQFVISDAADANGWTQFSGEFTAIDSSFKLRMFSEGSNTSGIVYFDDVIITPETDGASTYSSWASEFSVGAAEADDDLDGLKNLLEYALGGNPTNAIAGEADPMFTRVASGFDYTYKQRKADTSLVYRVEGCTNLLQQTWEIVAETARATMPGEIYNEVRLTLPAVEEHTCYRMRVSLPTNATPPNVDSTLWENYALNILPYERTGSPQDIIFTESIIGTSEFLILSSSHGNPGDVTEKEARTIGGGWVQAAYGGNDDKAVEIWFRKVTVENQNDLGQIDSNNAKAYLSIVAYDGLLNVGNIVVDKFLTNHTISINNSRGGPYLVVAVSDNGGASSMTDEFYGNSDDKTFIYLTMDSNFEDATADKIRGAIASIQLEHE